MYVCVRERDDGAYVSRSEGVVRPLEAILQMSTPPQILQLILYYFNIENKLTDSYGNSLLQNDFKNTV
jgi:hypothetical protein